MNVTDLSRSQLIELKQQMLIEELDSVSWYDLAYADSLVTDNAVYEKYNGVNFTENDFYN